MTIQTVRNRTATPIVINSDGRVLGGGEAYVYDDATITPANFAIIQRWVNEGALVLLTGNISIPAPTQGASYVKAEISNGRLVFTDSLGGTTVLTLPAGTGDGTVDLSGYVQQTDLTTALASKLNSATYTAGIATKADKTVVDGLVTTVAAKADASALAAKADASALTAKANTADVYTKAQVDTKIAAIPTGGGGGNVLILGPNDPIPEGTPSGTLIARRTT